MMNEIIKNALFIKDVNGSIRFWSYGNLNAVEKTYDVYSGTLVALFSTGGTVRVKKVLNGIKSLTEDVKSNVRLKRIKGYKSFDDLDIKIENIVSLDYLIYNHTKLTFCFEHLNKILRDALPDDNTDSNGLLKPMKAQPFKYGKFNYPAFAQPKINGIRGFIQLEVVIKGTGMFKEVVNEVTIRSKEGHLYILPHISKCFKHEDFYNKETEEYDIIYDGELYIPNKHLSYIKASIPMVNAKGTTSKPSNNPEQVQFWCFDLAVNGIQRERYVLLSRKNESIPRMLSVEDNLHKDFDNNVLLSELVRVTTYVVNDDKEVERLRDLFIQYGYEGVIIRDAEAYYSFGGRPKTMMKFKKHKDAEFKIKDVVPKDKEPETGMFILYNDLNDETFTCNPEGSYESRKEYLDNKDHYIGMMAKVKFYERSGVKQVPFHANVVEIIG